MSRKNAQAVEDTGAVPFVPFESDSLPPAEDSAWARMYHYFMFNGEEFLQHYHRHSSVEAVFSMVKAKFGDSIRSKSDTEQVNEALCKILAHNVCVLIHATHALGVEAAFTPSNVAYLPAR